MLKIGVIGTGHFGKIHLNCIKQANVFELVGFFDKNTDVSKQVSKDYNLKAFNNIDELIDAVDVVDIVTPATNHYKCVKKALSKNKHIFVEKPMVVDIIQAEELKKIILEKELKLQIGHVERFNPSFFEAKPYLNNIEYIETNRHSVYNNRNTDVSVVHDLMIHDLDLVLNTIKSETTDIRANGFSIISKEIDIANVRIEFANKCVANLSASRISNENIRKSSFYSKDTFVTIDYNKKETLIKKIKECNTSNNNSKNVFKNYTGNFIEFTTKQIETQTVNSVVNELISFNNSIINNTVPEVSIFDGYKSVKLANDILDYINKNNKL